jgi:catechol 2,3-dioxygenase-like lactoylglutathione lyase family enzyme
MAPRKKPAARSVPKMPKASFVSVAVVVSDKGRSRDWYTGKLGLDLIDEMDHWITVGRKGSPGVLHLCQTSDFDASIPAESGNTGIMFTIPGDFFAACDRLASNGVKFATPATKSAWGTWAMVADPDGNEICLMSG